MAAAVQAMKSKLLSQAQPHTTLYFLVVVVVGGGMTSPETTTTPTNLNSTGAGGGGGSQFSDCYFNSAGKNFNGLGLGAGTGSGFNAPQGQNINFVTPPTVDYSFYPAMTQNLHTDRDILNSYVANLQELIGSQIKSLYEQGYTITILGGGGGGVGMEFLQENGEEYNPHPVSVGYGFNFCHAFNKNSEYFNSDCNESGESTGNIDVQALLYKNIGQYFDRGLQIAIQPGNCNGYANSVCTCNFSYAYVAAQVHELLRVNKIPETFFPQWLLNPHCNTNTIKKNGRSKQNPRTLYEKRLLDAAKKMGESQGVRQDNMSDVMILKQLLARHDATTCQPPWV